MFFIILSLSEPLAEMTPFLPDYFFDLSSFQHNELFDKRCFVWEALSKIELYIKQQKSGKIEAKIPQGVYLIDPETVSIGEGTILEPGSYIKGPCIIGKNCTIRHGAYIRGNLIAGDGCVIGHDSEIKNVIMLNKAHAAHFAYVGDSILGNGVNLGAGTKCANLKLDNEPIAIYYDMKRVETGRRKLGAIIGDDSQLGCNAVCNPGTLLGKRVFCYPCVNFGGFVPSDKIVKSSSRAVIVEKKLQVKE